MRARKKAKICIAVIVVLTVVIGGLFYFRGNVVPLVTDTAYNTVWSKTVEALNTAYEVATEDMDAANYQNFVTIVRDDVGNVEMLSVNMLFVNKVMSNISTIIQNEMTSLLFDGVNVPLGAFSGIVLLGEHGLDVNLEIMTVGLAECSFRTEFESVGINQVLHSLYIDITAYAQVILPLESSNVECSSSLLLSENVIVGDVPEFICKSYDGEHARKYVPTENAPHRLEGRYGNAAGNSLPSSIAEIGVSGCGIRPVTVSRGPQDCG